MCRFCEAGQDIDDAKAQLQIHGYRFIQPNAPLEYGVAWDGRIISVSQQLDRVQQMADEQNASNPGRWEPKQRLVGPWEPVGESNPLVVKP